MKASEVDANNKKVIQELVDFICFKLDNEIEWFNHKDGDDHIEMDDLTIEDIGDGDISVCLDGDEIVLTAAQQKKIYKLLAMKFNSNTNLTKSITKWIMEHSDPRDIVRKRKEKEKEKCE